MTLIAGFRRNECPILMGDILISNNTESSTMLTFPTVGKISPDSLKNGIYRPSEFNQKVNLLSPHLALAWSGNLLEAKEFMAQIVGAGFHNDPSRERIIEIYNDLAPEDLSIIGLSYDAENITLFEKNSVKVNVHDSSFDWFQAGGTGYKRLLDAIPKKHSQHVKGSPNKLEYGIYTAISFTTHLLSLELYTGITLYELFGAGYEILHPYRNGLAKFTDLTYYFWNAEERAPGKWNLSSPFLAMKYSYHKDVLVIRSMSLRDGDTSKVWNDELCVIKPIYRIVGDEELVGYNPVSLNSRFISNSFFCKNFKGELDVFSDFIRYSEETSPVIWNNEFGLNAGVEISQEFLKEMQTKISLK
jgi:hypothetical protein